MFGYPRDVNYGIGTQSVLVGNGIKHQLPLGGRGNYQLLPFDAHSFLLAANRERGAIPVGVNIIGEDVHFDGVTHFPSPLFRSHQVIGGLGGLQGGKGVYLYGYNRGVLSAPPIGDGVLDPVGVSFLGGSKHYRIFAGSYFQTVSGTL